MSADILLIEDERNIARVIELELVHEGYDVTVADNGKDGLTLALEKPWDVVVLNIMLPGLDGLEVVRRLRSQGLRTPIILLTAKDRISDKVAGLDLGANDYLTKPFAVEELLARIRNLLRMFAVDANDHALQIEDLTIDPRSRKVSRSGQSIELTPREFELLLFLVKRQGHVLTRDELLSEVWGFDFAGQTNLVDVYIRYLRQKIDRGFPVKLIQTVRGVGYVLTVPET